jgi:hypothetical protein
MTMQFSDALATPSERLLRVGSSRERAEVAEAYAEAEAAFRAFCLADASAYASLSANALALLGSALLPTASASIQFVDADDPRHVLFSHTVAVSASSLGDALVPNAGIVIRLMGQGSAPVLVEQHAFSLLYGAPGERENGMVGPSPSPLSATEIAPEVECISIDEEALAAMDRASAEYRSRRASARAEERRLRRYDRE